MAGNSIDGNPAPIGSEGIPAGNSPTQPQGTPIGGGVGKPGNSSDGPPLPIPWSLPNGQPQSAPVVHTPSGGQPMPPPMTWPGSGGTGMGTPWNPIDYTRPYTEDLLLTYQFAVELSGMVQGYFLECSGLGVETEYIEHKLTTITGHSYVIAQPGRTKWNQLTLKRGITTSLDIWDWHLLVEHGKMKKARKNCTILMFKRNFEIAARWDLIRAWPVKVTGPESKADSSDYGLEEFVLAHEGMRRVKV